MKLLMPHRDYITKHKIDVDNADITPSLRRTIKDFDKQYQKWEDLKGDDSEEGKGLRKQWHEKLEATSKNILEELEEQLPMGKTIEEEEAEKKKAEKEKAEKEKAEKEKAEKEKNEKEKDEKEKAEKEKGKNPPKKEKEKEEEEDEESEEEKGEKIIDQLWKARAKDGKLEMTEEELNEKGFNCWSLLGMVSGTVGKYSFKSPFTETWTITKTPQKKED